MNTLLSDSQFTTELHMSLLAYESDPARAEEYAQRQMATRMAAHIVLTRVKKVIHEDYVEWRMDLYIASPAELWKMVSEEARRLSFCYSRTLK